MLLARQRKVFCLENKRFFVTCKDVHPSLLTNFQLAPAFNNSLTASSRPKKHASCNGVFPFRKKKTNYLD